METFESRFKRLSEKQSPINTNPLEEGFRSLRTQLRLEYINFPFKSRRTQLRTFKPDTTKKIPVVLPSSPIKFKANR